MAELPLPSKRLPLPSKKLRLPSKKLFDVPAFVDATEIDVLQMDRAYLLAPAGATADKPYVLLRETHCGRPTASPSARSQEIEMASSLLERMPKDFDLLA
ncbi:hypothetical protein [Streptomyces klenkii]